MMLRVQRERMNDGVLPDRRASTRRRYGLDGRRMATLQDHAIVMHPGPMVRGMEITADVADSDRSVIVEQVTNGVAVRMAVLYLLLGGADGRRPATLAPEENRVTAYLIKDAAILGGEPTDLLLEDGVIARSAAPATAGDAEVDRRAPGWSPCPAWSTCTPTCASPAARTPRPSRPAPRPPPWAASPRCTRWPTPTRSPTPPASSSRSGGSAARPATATSTRSARSRSGWPASGSPSSARWPTPRPGCGSSPTTASASATRC